MGYLKTELCHNSVAGSAGLSAMTLSRVEHQGLTPDNARMENPGTAAVTPVPLDALGAFRAMMRFAPFTREAGVGEPSLPLLLGILLACAEEPYGFHNPVGSPTGCGHAGSMCAPTLGNSSARFFTTERVRRILVATRDGTVGERVREVLQAQLALRAVGGAPSVGWACAAAWFKQRMLECVFAPVPEVKLFLEAVPLDDLLQRLAEADHAD